MGAVNLRRASEITSHAGVARAVGLKVEAFEALRLLMEEHSVLGLAGCEEMGSFKKDAASLSVKRVFKRYDLFLRTVFKVYAAVDQDSDAAASAFDTINFTEFLGFLRDANLLDGSLPVVAVQVGLHL